MQSGEIWQVLTGIVAPCECVVVPATAGLPHEHVAHGRAFYSPGAPAPSVYLRIASVLAEGAFGGAAGGRGWGGARADRTLSPPGPPQNRRHVRRQAPRPPGMPMKGAIVFSEMANTSEFDKQAERSSALDITLAYHERTKHRLLQSASALGHMDYRRRP